MITSMLNCDNYKTTEIIGKRLKGLIKRAIKEGKYSSQQDFFDQVQKRIENTNTDVTNPNTYNNYLNGGTNMKLDVLKQICIELDCSANYLMGISFANTDYQGSILRMIYDIDPKINIMWDEYETDMVQIDYYGKTITYDCDELKNKIKDLINATLFIDSKKDDK